MPVPAEVFPPTLPVESARPTTALGPPPAAPRAAQLALRVLQVGIVAAVLMVATYRSFDLDRFFIPKELVLHLTAFTAGLLALGTMRRVRLARVDAWLLGFLAVSTLSALLAPNLWAGLRALAISVSGVAVFWIARAVREAGLARPLLGTLAFGVSLAAATALMQAYGITTDFFSINRAPGGTLGNRNFVGHLAAFGMPVLLLAALRARRLRPFLLAAVGLLLVMGALVLTRSRAAWLGVAAVLVVMIVGSMLTPSVRRSPGVLLRFALLLAFAGGGAALALLLPNTLDWLSDNPYRETAEGLLNYREGSGQGRLVQYRQSLVMTLRDPLLGAGPGNWPVVYPAFAAPNDPSLTQSTPGMTANPWPSSDWVAMLSERGLLGLLLLVMTGWALARRAWRTLRSTEDPNDGLGAVVLLASTAGIIITGTFDAVLLLAWPTLFFWATAGALFPNGAVDAVPTTSWRGPLLLLILALLAGAGAVRSGGAVVAMALYDADTSLQALERASRLDPGSYRVHLRLAQRYRRDRAQRCAHAQTAHALFPEAVAARRIAAGCE